MAERVTLKEIANELDISVMTVSRALNGRANVDQQTRAKVIRIAEELGYRPNNIARSLVTDKTYTLGVVVPEITHSFFPEVIKGIENVAHDRRYQLILMHSMEDYRREAEAISTLESKRVDGILLSTAENIENNRIYKDLVESDYPLVFFDRCVFDIGACCVSVDDYNSAQRITNHLIEHGYTEIAHLCGSERLSIGIKRKKGFLDALAKEELPVTDDWMITTPLDEEGGYEAMNRILDLPENQQPEAIVAVNDPVALGAMEAIYDADKSIPEDFAVVGFSDDVRARLVKSPLTTVHQPAYEVGRAAAQKLIDLIENEDEKIEQIEVETEIVKRASCGCPFTRDNVFVDVNLDISG